MSERPFTIQGLDHIVLRVSDLAAMLDFYVDVLGCPIENEQRAIGLIQLRAGTALIDLVPVDGPLGRMGGAAPGAEGRNLDHLCLAIDGFDEATLRAYLAQRGVDAGESGSRYGAQGQGPRSI